MTDTELPNTWHWGSGEVTGDSETYWFYSNLRFHYQGQMYTDPGKDWIVHFYEETGLTDHGDLIVDEYPVKRGSFETEDEALDYLLETANELIDY